MINRTRSGLSIKRFFKMLNNYRPSGWIISLTVLLTLTHTALSLIVPLITMNIVNEMVESQFSFGILATLFVILIAQILFSATSFLLMIHIGELIIARLRETLWKHITHLPISFYDKNDSGEVVSRITNDTNVIKNFFVDHLIPFVTGLITLTGSLIILMVIDWSITLIILIACPLCLLIIKPLGSTMYQTSKTLQDETASLHGVLSRVLSNIRLVKLSVAEHEEVKQGNYRINNLYRYGMKTGKVIAVVGPLMTTVVLLVLIAIFGYGGYKISTGALSTGALVAIVFYIFQIISPLTLMAQFFTHLQKANGAAERISELLHEEKEGSEDSLTSPIVTNDNSLSELQFSNVSFGYKNEPTINNITFSVKQGEKLAIVGPSGAGKTTIFSLVERFYNPGSGLISYNGLPIENHKLETWREAIAYVSQDTPVMTGSIRKNLTYGIKREVSDTEIHQAIKQANLEEFLGRLENGLDTEVGERGIRLSGGQKQRLTIARAIIRDPEILLLDEATAHLDGHTEALVQEALDQLMKNRTTIIIAHRLSTVKNADRLLVLEDGKIIEEGTHEELYKASSLYYTLFNKQSSIDLNVTV